MIRYDFADRTLTESVYICGVKVKGQIMSELRKRMIRQMQLRNLSPGTQRAYLKAVTGLAEYYHQSPDRIGTEEIQDYVGHLFSKRRLAVGSCHGIITGLHFFVSVQTVLAKTFAAFINYGTGTPSK